MRSVSIRQLDMKQATIPLGFEGENDFTEVRIDCKKTFDQHPNAVPSMTVTDPAGNKYPAVVTRDGDIVVWNITAGDLTTKGSGEIQIEFLIDGTIIGRTDVARTRIERSIFAEGEAPDPVQDWVSEANRLLALIRSAIPAGGTVGQFLGKKSNSDFDTEWKTPSGGGGGGTTNYNDLDNKPQIEGHTLTGNVTLETLGALSTTALAAAINTALAQAKQSGEFDGANGDDGVGIADIEKTGTSGLVDTYTITLTDGTTSTFTVTNGAKGDPGNPGADGVSPTVSVSSITGGHRVSVTDKNGTQTFDVMDGVSAIDDTAGRGDTNKVLSADKVTEITDGLREAIMTVTPEQFGAKGDGTTDDSQAVQDAIDAGYAVRFADNKTYFIADTVTIDHDVHLIGGENTVIKTETPSSGTSEGIVVTGTLKKTTTLTGDYATTGSTDNCGNQFTLSDMTGINIGDILVITATDQYYSYARPAYYLGAVLLVSDIYDGHIYTSDSMPWNIENTQNVSVKVYSAPSAIIEKINFVSDYDGTKNNGYLVRLSYCKNAIVKNCNMSQMVKGLNVQYCVNTLVDCVTVAKSKYDNTINHDGYGIKIDSSTNTIIRRVLSICSQGCLDMGGDVPNLNTYVYNCDLSSECRSIGIDMHENSYNLIVEDCVLGGASFYGTVQVNRCRFIQNTRGNSIGISFRGSHNPEWAKIKITNCEFNDGMSVQLLAPSPQSPIQSFDNVYGGVIIEDCEGGLLQFIASTSSTITANILKQLIIKGWKNCDQITHAQGNKIEYMEVVDSTFGRSVWLNKQNSGSVFYFAEIKYLSVHNDHPKQEKLFVDITKDGGRFFLPEGIGISLSASAQTTYYIVCGENIASNDADDYINGAVSGNVGDAITFTPYDILANALDVVDGKLVFTQPSNYSGAGQIFSKCMTYVAEDSTVKMSCKLKNTGATDGQSYRPYIAVVDCKTGKITYKGNGTAGTASASGVTITHKKDVPADSLVLCYLSCSAVEQGSETTFEDFVAKIIPADMYDDSETLAFKEYTGSSLVGDGTLNSVEGINYVMSSTASFEASFKVDYLANPVGALPSAVGVSF